MDREKIRLQSDYLKLLENLEIDIKNVSYDLREEEAKHIRDYDNYLIEAIKKIKKSSDVGHQKSIGHELLTEKNNKLSEISKKAFQLLVDEMEIYCKEVEQKIEEINK
jgi:hypothetical protein